MNGDTISRQAAIDAICEHGTDLERRGITVLSVANHKQATVDLLENLPSAEAEQVWLDAPITSTEFITHSHPNGYELHFRTDDVKKYEAVQEECRRQMGHGKPSAERLGRWIDIEHAPNGLYYATCSVCGERQTVEAVNYCGNCGAKMEVEENEND